MSMKNHNFTKDSKITRTKEIPITTGKIEKKKEDINKVNTGSSNRSTTVRMDRDIINQVKIEAIKQDITMKDYLENLVIKDLGIKGK